jgi:hypothetical protein
MKSEHRDPILTPKERASLLKTKERLREIGRTRSFTEDEADTAYAIQVLLKEEPGIPLETVLKEIDRDLGRRSKTPGEKATHPVGRRRKA